MNGYAINQQCKYHRRGVSQPNPVRKLRGGMRGVTKKKGEGKGCSPPERLCLEFDRRVVKRDTVEGLP